MSEIKFRLIEKKQIVGYERWNSMAGKWCYDTEPNGVFDIRNVFIAHTDKDYFTGLKDKQGNEIYEGDLLTYPKHKGYYQIRWLCDDSDCGFVCERKEPYNYMLPAVWGKMKVVGNIYVGNLLDTKTEK